MKKESLRFYLLPILLDVIGVGILIPVIPALFTDTHSSTFLLTGYSVGSQYLIAGLMTALFGIMQFLAAPLLGDLSDTYGRLPGIEVYNFSTGCRHFLSQAQKIAGNLFNSRRRFSAKSCAR